MRRLCGVSLPGEKTQRCHLDSRHVTPDQDGPQPGIDEQS
jgi:hypothetical protein